MHKSTGLTYGTEKAEEEEEDDTPNHITVDATFQLTALVARTSVIQHSFCLMTCRTAASLYIINLSTNVTRISQTLANTYQKCKQLYCFNTCSSTSIIKPMYLIRP